MRDADSFRPDMYHIDPQVREKWWEAIREDINSHEEPEEYHPTVVENDWIMDWED